MIIGITGGTGCGKTTALNTIRQLGGQVLDCDAIYHELLKTDEALLSAIESRFPGTVKEGSLDRKALGAVVFSDAIALFESGLAALCDLTVAVTAPLEDRVRRLMARDRISESYARNRIQAQPPEDYFRGLCDHILENSGTEEAFQEKCLAFFTRHSIM